MKRVFGAKIFFACGALKREARCARAAERDPPSIEHPRHLPGGGRYPGALLGLSGEDANYETHHVATAAHSCTAAEPLLMVATSGSCRRLGRTVAIDLEGIRA